MTDQPDRDRRVDIVQLTPTSWLDPIDISRTGLQTVLAGLFGSFADKREVLAALYPGDDKVTEPAFSYAKQEEVWFDYISDTGDGWNPTYSIACLVGEDELDVGQADGGSVKLKRAAFTILGGDQVYPVASAEQYRERLEGPFYCARATSNRTADRRPVYALPGNHDWYDGLTSFIRLFCQKDRWVGQWTATQTRSYFAVELPHRWWIWGLDVQLESDLDPAQVRYFKRYAEFLKPGDHVIIASPEPTWIEAGRVPETQPKSNGAASRSVSQAHRNMTYLETLITRKQAVIPVRIAGDLHHYARYEGADGESQLITCGGGGAFLHGTFGLPEQLQGVDAAGQTFKPKTMAPTAAQSEALVPSVLRNLLLRNPLFAVAVGAIYWIYSWFLQSASETLNTLRWKEFDATLLDYLRDGVCIVGERCPNVIGAWWDIVWRDPLLFFFSVVIIVGCSVFTGSSSRSKQSKGVAYILGALHGAAHILLALALITISTFFPWNVFVHPTVFVLGAIPGSLLVAAYLWLAHATIGAHDQEVLSTQAIEDYKCFARFHVTKDAMTIYPVGLEKVCKAWVPAPGVVVEEAKPGSRLRPRAEYKLKVPAGTHRVFVEAGAEKLAPRLMEAPIVLKAPVSSQPGLII